MPDQVGVETVVMFLSCTFSCPTVDGDALRLATTSAQTVELPVELMAAISRIQRTTSQSRDVGPSQFLDRAERLAAVHDLSTVLRDRPGTEEGLPAVA